MKSLSVGWFQTSCLILIAGLAGCSGSGSGSTGSGGGGGTSNPVPSISAVSPSTATAGSGAFTLTVSGSLLMPNSVVNWNGQPRTTVYINSTRLTASIPASDIATKGTAKIKVTTPAPGGGTSSELTLTIAAALPPLSTRTDWRYIGAKVDAGDENFFYPPYLAYDAKRNQLFLSVPGSNVVKVFDTQTHAQKTEISISSPYGIDISADGESVYVGTGTQFLYVLDPSTLHVKQVIDSTTVLPGGFSSVFVFAMSDGTVVIVPGLGVDGDGPPLIWSPANGSASVISGNMPVIGAVARSGDRSSIIVTSPFTSGGTSVYSLATKTFISTPYTPGDIVGRVAANPVKDQFAVSDLDGNIFIYNSSLAQLGAIRIEPPNQIGGQRLNGMVFSGDGARLHLFVDETIQEYDTASFTQHAVMAQPYSLGVFAEPLPLVEDNSGMIFGINEEGLDFIDVSKIQGTGLTTAPYGYGYGVPYLNANTGPVAGGTPVSGGIGVSSSSSETGTIVAAYLGTTPVWDLSASGNQFSFEAPSVTSAGRVNMIVNLTDGTPLLAPEAFSYGPDVVRLVSNTSGADGGGTGFLAGYGLGSSTSDLQITIGGQAAKVTNISTSLAGLDEPFATPMQSASFTVPKGVTGAADVTLTTSAGSKTLADAFQFNPSTTLHATTAPLEAGVYDPTRKAIYYTTTNQILTWSISGNMWLSPISVPSSTSAALTGISISPNGQYVAAADQGNRSIVVFNPDSPQGIESFPVSDGGFGLNPASVAISNQGKVYFNVAFTYRGGWGTRCQGDLMWMLDATSGAATDLDPFGQVSQFCMYITDRVLLSSDGNSVFVDDDGGLALYDVPSGQWTFLAGSEGGNSDMAMSGDNSRLFATLSLIDWNRGYLGTPAWSDLDLSDNQTLLVGEKLDRNGTLLLQPWSQALDVVDLSHFVNHERIALPYPVQDVFDPLVWDDDNDTAYMIVNGGLLEVPLTAPLILQAATPASGSAGTTVTLLGSGFASDDTATVDGIAAALTVIDEHTATLVTPDHADGAAVIVVTASNQQSSSLDPGFIYGAASLQAPQRIRNIFHPMRSPMLNPPNAASPARGH